MKCPVCDGTGTSNTCVNGTFKPCTFCDGTGEVKDNLCETCGTICPFDDEHLECDNYTPLTNEGWLRTATTEQLANVFFEYRYANATPRQKLWMSASEKCIKTDIVEWLKQLHKE